MQRRWTPHTTELFLHMLAHLQCCALSPVSSSRFAIWHPVRALSAVKHARPRSSSRRYFPANLCAACDLLSPCPHPRWVLWLCWLSRSESQRLHGGARNHRATRPWNWHRPISRTSALVLEL
eukprot:scaffold1087_cov198-Pinguiococcus_pyrenoidosus.AAC.28